MIKKLYAWTLSLAAHPRALWALAILSFLESSVFPIPPDILMIAMILSQPKRAFLIAGITLIASVIGGIFGYFLRTQFADKSKRKRKDPEIEKEADRYFEELDNNT